MKRFLALLLCLLICVSLLPAAAFAEGSIELAEEDGTEEQTLVRHRRAPVVVERALHRALSALLRAFGVRTGQFPSPAAKGPYIKDKSE